MLGRSGPDVKSPDQIQVDAPGRRARGGDPRAVSRGRARRASPPASWTSWPSGTSARAAACRRSSACRAGRGPDFPATLCISVNDEVVHGIPGARVLADGDLVSVDCGAIVDGWHGDAAISVVVGDRQRPAGTALWWRPPRPPCGTASRAAASAAGCTTSARRSRTSCWREPARRTASSRTTSGTASAESMHEDPQVPNYRVRDQGAAGRRRAVRGRRADADRRLARRPAPWTTAGPWSPSTAAGPRTGSTRWR